ncbi:MAG: hypothetical protein QOH95_2333, partial [Gaiellaceae bacterium]|nr:hypothetical protein [Gaiellaceae bacterium]
GLLPSGELLGAGVEPFAEADPSCGLGVPRSELFSEREVGDQVGRSSLSEVGDFVTPIAAKRATSQSRDVV